jgi:hypothetical protein
MKKLYQITIMKDETDSTPRLVDKILKVWRDEEFENRVEIEREHAKEYGCYIYIDEVITIGNHKIIVK